MRRGEVYDVDFEPVQGSEQGGTRPAIIVSNDSIDWALVKVDRPDNSKRAIGRFHSQGLDKVQVK